MFSIVEEKAEFTPVETGIISESQLEVEINRVRKYRAQQESKLKELETQIKSYEQADYNYSQFNQVLSTLADRLQNADFNLKQLALEALNIQVTLKPDRTIVINGVIPEQVQPTYTNSSYWWLRPSV